VETIHASCIEIDGRAALLTGRSGSGKSTLALNMLNRGAKLVADDRVILKTRAGQLLATCPARLQGVIEARHFALLHAPFVSQAIVQCVVDLDRVEPNRLPPLRRTTISGIEIDLYYGKNTPALADALALYLRNGRYV